MVKNGQTIRPFWGSKAEIQKLTYISIYFFSLHKLAQNMSKYSN